jgi:hypothetical protein
MSGSRQPFKVRDLATEENRKITKKKQCALSFRKCLTLIRVSGARPVRIVNGLVHRSSILATPASERLPLLVQAENRHSIFILIAVLAANS